MDRIQIFNIFFKVGLTGIDAACCAMSVYKPDSDRQVYLGLLHTVVYQPCRRREVVESQTEDAVKRAIQPLVLARVVQDMVWQGVRIHLFVWHLANRLPHRFSLIVPLLPVVSSFPHQCNLTAQRKACLACLLCDISLGSTTLLPLASFLISSISLLLENLPRLPVSIHSVPEN